MPDTADTGSIVRYTPLDEIPKIREHLRKSFKSGKLRPIAYRRRQLLQLAYLLKDNKHRFEEAFYKDLGKPTLESDFMEINATISEAVDAYKNVSKWAKTESAPFSLTFAPMRPKIRKEPKGVILMISPFNYPLYLSLRPLAGAIAAGNAVVLKPSESSVHISALLTELFPLYLDPDLFRVVNGAVPETTKLLELQWDHILYTGSGRVGKIVASAAAKHLTPVTLELGGKSPVIIDPRYDLRVAARRILWGKFVNAGQTCVAPDYVLIPGTAQSAFVEAVTQVYKEFYPGGPAASNSFGRIINPGQFARLQKLVSETKGKVILGGADEADEKEKYIPPTVVTDVGFDDPLMRDELFGPILPIVPVESAIEAIAYINAHDHPLALYVFSDDSVFKTHVYDETQSGGVVANDVALQPGVHGLPFGGVGASGYGIQNGKYSFDTFTHLRATVDSPKWLDWFLGFRFPPYTPSKLKSANGIGGSVPRRIDPKPEGLKK